MRIQQPVLNQQEIAEAKGKTQLQAMEAEKREKEARDVIRELEGTELKEKVLLVKNKVAEELEKIGQVEQEILRLENLLGGYDAYFAQKSPFAMQDHGSSLIITVCNELTNMNNFILNDFWYKALSVRGDIIKAKAVVEAAKKCETDASNDAKISEYQLNRAIQYFEDTIRHSGLARKYANESLAWKQGNAWNYGKEVQDLLDYATNCANFTWLDLKFLKEYAASAKVCLTSSEMNLRSLKDNALSAKISVESAKLGVESAKHLVKNLNIIKIYLDDLNPSNSFGHQKGLDDLLDSVNPSNISLGRDQRNYEASYNRLIKNIFIDYVQNPEHILSLNNNQIPEHFKEYTIQNIQGILQSICIKLKDSNDFNYYPIINYILENYKVDNVQDLEQLILCQDLRKEQKLSQLSLENLLINNIKAILESICGKLNQDDINYYNIINSILEHIGFDGDKLVDINNIEQLILCQDLENEENKLSKSSLTKLLNNDVELFKLIKGEENSYNFALLTEEHYKKIMYSICSYKDIDFKDESINKSIDGSLTRYLNTVADLLINNFSSSSDCISSSEDNNEYIQFTENETYINFFMCYACAAKMLYFENIVVSESSFERVIGLYKDFSDADNFFKSENIGQIKGINNYKNKLYQACENCTAGKNLTNLILSEYDQANRIAIKISSIELKEKELCTVLNTPELVITRDCIAKQKNLSWLMRFKLEYKISLHENENSWSIYRYPVSLMLAVIRIFIKIEVQPSNKPGNADSVGSQSLRVDGDHVSSVVNEHDQSSVNNIIISEENQKVNNL